MFKFQLPPEALARIQAESREATRLYGLRNAWLASALLQLARQAQASRPEIRAGECTYDARLIWGIVPEIARRLGVVKLTTNEIDWEIRPLSDYQLRVRTGYTIANTERHRLPGWSQLTRDPEGCNAVVVALDRLCPGRVEDRDDPITRRLVEIARVRGTTYNGVWTPEIGERRQEWQGEAEGDDEEEVEPGPAP